MYDEDFLKETLLRAFENPDFYNVPQGIRRHDFQNAHGWWVRVSRDRVMFRQLFSDSTYGSIEEAFRHAILYRHEILSTFPITITRKAGRTLLEEPESRIGRYEEEGNRQPYIYWKARWYDKNYDIKTENFSVLKYGEAQAKSMALEAAKSRHNYKPRTVLSKVPDPYEEHKFSPILRSDVAIWATVNNQRPSQKKSKLPIEAEVDIFAFEGEKIFQLHQSIERNKTLRNQKIVEFLKNNGRLYCELCGFSFKNNYPFLKVDIIEVHHIIPLAKLSQSTLVELHDLMLLCSNCHFVVHQGDAEENLLLATDHFRSRETSA